MTDDNEHQKDKDLPNCLDRAILDEIDKTISVRTANGQERISVYQALVKKITNTAMNGSPHAQRHVCQLIKEATARQENEYKLHRFYYDDYQIDITKAYESHKKKGGDPLWYAPCPEDIEFDEKHIFKVKGPLDDGILDYVRHVVKRRDACFYQIVLEDRLCRGKSSGGISSAHILWEYIDRSLPRRFRFQDNNGEFFSAFRACRHMTKRSLLRETYQAWQAVGIPYPRGYIFPNYKEWEGYIKCARKILLYWEGVFKHYSRHSSAYYLPYLVDMFCHEKGYRDRIQVLHVINLLILDWNNIQK